MPYKNGFFQVIIKDDGTYIRLYPAMQGGQPITFEDVSSYLNKKKIIEYDIKALNEAIVKAKNPVEICLNHQVIMPEDEYLMLSIDDAKMKVTGRFYPPTSKGKLITREEILKDLDYAGIKHGISEQNIDSFLKTRKYCTDIIMAEGTEPIQGKNAVITYHFDVNKNSKPQLNEDGSVDFHKLDMISHVNKGDVLATLEPADMGKDGMDVLGNVVKPNKVINKVLKHGKFITLSEDGRVMITDVSGHAMLTDDKVFVSNTYEVSADVDASTGDIEYDGNVVIKGNVITGFSVKASGDIIVEGVVEGASLTAMGQIILKRGIQGMNRGTLKAESNIIANFIENSEVYSNGYITTDAIMHSKVSAKGDIIISGRKGFVTGGEVRSGTMIEMKTAGSTMGTATILEVGIDPGIVEEYRKLEKDLETFYENKDKLSQVLTRFKKKLSNGEKIPQDKLLYLQTVSKSYSRVEENITEAETRYVELKEVIENTEGGCIVVKNVAYPGVKIVISNVVYFIRSETHFSQFVRDRADIKVKPLG